MAVTVGLLDDRHQPAPEFLDLPLGDVHVDDLDVGPQPGVALGRTLGEGLEGQVRATAVTFELDPALLHLVDADAEDRRAWSLLGAMALSLAALSFDVNGIGTALPELSRELGLGPGAQTWVVNANVIAMGSTLLLAGHLADRLGRRRPLLTGIAGFAIGSALCTLAPGGAGLIGGRVVQGLASALIFTTSLGVVMDSFRPERRSSAIGAWGAIAGAGSALGPVLAGVLTSTVSWRAFFALNVPLCALSLVAVALLVPHERPTAATTNRPWTLGLLTVALFAIVFALQQGPVWGWTAPGTLVPLAFGPLALAGLLRTERRRTDRIVPVAVTSAPRFLGANAVAGTGNWAFGLAVVHVAIYLQGVRGFNAVGAGGVFLAFSGAFGLASALMGTLDRHLGVSVVMGAGGALMAGGFAVLVFTTQSTPLVVILAGLLLAGAGQGLVFDGSTAAGLEGVPPMAAADASAVTQTVRLMAMGIGLAVANALVVGAGGTGDVTAQLAGFRRVMLSGVVVSVAWVGAALLPPRSRVSQ